MKQNLVFIVVFMFISGCGIAPSPVDIPPSTGSPQSPVVISPEMPATVPPPLPSSDYAVYLPNLKITPGDTLDVTSADICVAGYSSKIRNVPESVKNQAYSEYGIFSRAPGQYEVDHLISLELGGSNSIKNLWPESYTGPWNAHIKDKLEDRLHSLVCKGSLDLKTAQTEIATDWISAYQKYIGQP